MAAPGAAAPGSGSAESEQKLIPRRDEQLLLTVACPNSCKQLGELAAIGQSTRGTEQSWSRATHTVRHVARPSVTPQEQRKQKGLGTTNQLPAALSPEN